MQALKKFSTTVGVILVIVLIGYFIVSNYSFVFSKVVEGRIIGVERVTTPTAILTGQQASADNMFSYSVLIEDDATKTSYSSSSTDRQFAVAKYCARAKIRFYPYPFWNFEKSGTYFNARVEQLYDCKKAEDVAPDSAAAPVPDHAALPPQQAAPTAGGQ